MSRFARWANDMLGLPPTGLRAECERALAREQARGKINGKFSQAVRAVQAFLEDHLPDADVLARFDDETRAALLAIAESLSAQGAVRPELLRAARNAFAPPQKAQKRFREFVERVKHLPAHELAEVLDREIIDLEARGDKSSNTWWKLKTLRMMVAGQAVQLDGLRRRTRKLFKAVADRLLASGAISADVLAQPAFKGL